MSTARAWSSGRGDRLAGEPMRLPARSDSRPDVWADGKVVLLGVAIVALILAGMAIGSDRVALAGVMAALAAGFAFPQVGLIVLAVIGTLKPPGVIPAPGFEIVLVGASIVGCLLRLPVDRRRLTVSAPLVALTAFVAFAFLSQLPALLSGYSSTKAHDIGFLFYQLATCFGTLVLAGFVLRGQSPYPVFLALLLSAMVAAALAVSTASGGGFLANLVASSEEGARPAGPFGNPNNFGQCMAYGGILALAWAWTSGGSARRYLLVLVGSVLIYAVAVSLSRGAMVALLMGFVAFAFARSRATGVAAAVAVLAIVGIGYPLFLQFRLSVDFSSSSMAALAELNSSDAGRLGTVLAAPGLFATSPVFGVGFGQYKYLNELGLVAHNWYGTVLAELGIVGIGLWAAVLITTWRWLRRRPAPARQVGIAMFLAALAGCMFLQPPTSVQTAIIPGLVIAAALVAHWGRGRVAEEAPARGSTYPARSYAAPALPPAHGSGLAPGPAAPRPATPGRRRGGRRV
jgi:O-antigen ligase